MILLERQSCGVRALREIYFRGLSNLNYQLIPYHDRLPAADIPRMQNDARTARFADRLFQDTK